MIFTKRIHLCIIHAGNMMYSQQQVLLLRNATFVAKQVKEVSTRVCCKETKFKMVVVKEKFPSN